MDRGRRPAALAVALAAFGLTASDAPPAPAEMRWLAPGADPVAALALQPPECLATPADADAAWSVEVGRAAFRSPLILGGQAARAGISCESCHRNGRTNPAFRFPGLSGAPGTADVTSSLFSSRRGDGIDDPRPIPDLAGPRAGLKVSPDPERLPAFLRGLVVEEFDGPEPPPAVLAGLVAYVRALDPARCEGGAAPVTAAVYLSDAARAARAAAEALRRGEPPTALAMLAAARARLGRIDERYPASPRARAALRRASAGLAAIEAAVRRGDPAAAAEARRWPDGVAALEAVLARDASGSLFAPERLRAAADAARLPARGP